MKISKLSKTLTPALTIALLAAPLANATVILAPSWGFTPDGTNTVSLAPDYDIQTANGGTDVLNQADGPITAYIVSSFTFGTGSNAHLSTRFNATNGAGRLQINVNDDGLVFTGGAASGTTFDLAQDMAGQTVTLISKFYYDADNSVTYAQGNASNDTVMNTWVNPTALSVEGSGFSAGDLSAIANSATFRELEQRIDNLGTPGTAGDSFMTNTVLTGADATFANALAIAIVPEPSTTALLGLGGLALILRRRK